MSIEEVQKLLEKFQDGYTQRDPASLDTFMTLFSEGHDLEVIGTNAIQPGMDEWCLGSKAVREIIKTDWEHWGDVLFDLENVRIHLQGDIGWLATSATVTDVISVDQRYHGYLDYVRHILENKDLHAEEKMHDIVQMGNDIMVDLTRSEQYVWPLRFTAVVIKQDGEWKFKQITFSFPTTRTPDVRF